MKQVIPEYDTASLYPNTKRLSSSQVLTYLKDPQRFYVEYVLGGKGEKSKAMMLGSIFSACYQNRELDYEKLLSDEGFSPDIINLFGQALSRFPVQINGFPEYPMIAEHKDWEFRASLDDYIEKEHIIIENKTGKAYWTEKRVEEDMQLTFQAWCHWKKIKKTPKYILLSWWNTGTKSLRIKNFKTKRTVSQLKEFEKLIDKVIQNLEAQNFSNPIT